MEIAMANVLSQSHLDSATDPDQGSRRQLDQESPLPVEKRSKPVVCFAVIGVLFMALELYVLGSWIFSGDAKGTPLVSVSVPTRMKVFIVFMSVVGVCGAIVMLYRVVWRGWYRQRIRSGDALMCLAFCTLWWQDPFVNYSQNWVTAN